MSGGDAAGLNSISNSRALDPKVLPVLLFCMQSNRERLIPIKWKKVIRERLAASSTSNTFFDGTDSTIGKIHSGHRIPLLPSQRQGNRLGLGSAESSVTCLGV